jgi:urease accessory protein
MQLADSFFPSGMFGASGGLESVVKTGRVENRRDVLQFIRQQVRFQLVPCDCMILSATIDAAKQNDISTAVATDNMYYSMKMVREVRTASVRSGRQLLNCMLYIAPNKFASKFQRRIESGQTIGTYPSCLALAAYSLGVPKKSALRIMLYSYSVSIVGSAIRLGVIQHLEGQKILTQLAGEVEAVIRVKKTVGHPELWQLSPLVDILNMQHERDELRMFIT